MDEGEDTVARYASTIDGPDISSVFLQVRSVTFLECKVTTRTRLEERQRHGSSRK